MYLNYAETIRGLVKQEVQGFYKGNWIGIIYEGCRTLAKVSLINPVFYSDNIRQKETNLGSKIFVVFAFSSLCDIIIQPFHVMQSRFILQNRLPGFFTYRSIWQYLRQNVHNASGMFVGWRATIPTNALFSLATGYASVQSDTWKIVSSFSLSHFLLYPVWTAQRRLECQIKTAGMIPIRYKNLTHAVRLILQEEGVKGLYRGGLAYIAARSLEAFLISRITTSTNSNL